MPDRTTLNPADRLGQLFTRALADGESVNDFLRRFHVAIADTLGVSASVLYDYDEVNDAFDLLYFVGYAPDARSALHRRMSSLDLRRALRQRDPYPADGTGRQLLLPLYFRDTLEAVLLLEHGAGPFVLDEQTKRACHMVSRFVGLFMSSNRLAVNQPKTQPATSDLERAREVQQSYLPSRYPETDRYEIFGYNQSSALVGGDYVDFFQHDDARVQCVLADACGHGLAAALVMSNFRGLLQSEVRRPDDPGTLFTRLNQLLYASGGSLSYLTGIFLDYHHEEGRLRYLNAGHFDPVVLRASGDVSHLGGGGPPLGMFPTSDYVASSATVAPGDLLVLFTDGLVELANTADECFGVEGACRSALAHRHRPLPELASEILAAASVWSGRSKLEDDLTLFLMRFR
jgi:serine phosphatase RsbU (regulator of sigma subunit)